MLNNKMLIINELTKRNLIIIFIALLLNSFIDQSYSLCEIESGENVAIVEIEESQGNQLNQSTIPRELPIKGNEREIILTIQSETHKYFDLRGKELRLNKPLDKDKNGLSSIYLQISCYDKRNSVKHSIPVLVKVKDINDNSPVFTKNEPYSVFVSELAPIGTTIFRNLKAKDSDSGNNGLVEYFTVPGDGSSTDGFGYFEINMPHQGLVTVAKPLDYEKVKLYYLTIIATDKAEKESERFSATATLTIHIEDGDDLDPTFVYKECTLISGGCVNPEYKSAVTSGSLSGILRILPESIHAHDRDSINNPIKYTFASGTPAPFAEYFHIDPSDGTVRQLKPVDRNAVTKQFDLVVKAEEISPNKRMASAKLIIDVLPADKNPPVLTPSSYVGFVSENSPMGTTVHSNRNGTDYLKISVSDSDITTDDVPAVYSFEVTSNSFTVNADGFLIVSEPYLDRDPPRGLRTYTFQIIARQIGSPEGKGSTAPISLSVHLLDVNDNAPKLPVFSPIRVQSGDESRIITQVHAHDIDEGENARVVYTIHHVSNNGKNKFKIDAESGQIEAIGKLVNGDQYSITIQATDTGNKYSQSILDVIVVPGPNTGGPIFQSDRYETEISEGASLFSPVVTVHAIDPENDPIIYSIINGNINEDFAIGPQSGIISIHRKLDREEIASYNLVIKAEDHDRLFSTANVLINVLDVNDQNPQFVNDKYLFRVDEGSVNAYVGKVTAKDNDIGENGEVIYAISDTSKFHINPNTGDIYTKMGLDYEKQKTYNMVITARDKSPNARLATASVTIEVLDISDELPYFEKLHYEAIVPENAANHKILQLKAIDPDSIPMITYVIKDGDSSLFSIDPNSGVLNTVRGLDYEKRNSHSLKIGTLENESNDERAVCTVQINVSDLNDNPPVFQTPPLPMRIQDTVSLGTIVTTVVAIDSDGTPPGNQIRYEIIGRDRASFYFLIDSSTGEISVKDDLKKDPESEYRIIVRAKDLGTPHLSATTTVTVYVEHLATIAPESSLGFVDSRYTVEIEENVLTNYLVKTLPVINKPRGNFQMTCEIISGNEANRFYIIENEQKDCEVRVRDNHLDYEKQSRYLLTIRLSGIGGVNGVSRLITQLNINILDLNDNTPEFILPSRYSHLTGEKYLAAIASEAPSDTQILLLKAKDLDSGSNGVVTYELSPQTDPDGRFKIDSYTGILRSNRPVEDIPSSQLPMQLKVIARDNPELFSSSLSESVDVIVNVIEEKHRMALVLKDTSNERVQDVKEELLTILQERTGMIAGFERAESLKMQRNNSIESDVTGTDLWFHLVEPGSLRIIPSDDLRIKSSIFDTKPQNSLLKKISQSLGFHAYRVRHPFVPVVLHSANFIPVPITTDISDLGAALIILACIIAIFGAIGIIYQCCIWSRYKSHHEQIKRMPPPSTSRLYDPIYVEPSLKEYETQVLQMSVPIIDDDASFNESLKKLNGKLSLKNLMPDIYVPPSRGKSKETPNFRNSVPRRDGQSIAPDVLMQSKNPLYCELMEEHIPSSRSQTHDKLQSNTIFSEANNFPLRNSDKTTEL